MTAQRNQQLNLALRDNLHRARFRLASVQAILQNPGEAINDDARVAADLDLDDVSEVIGAVLQSIK
ncbi:MAG: hypothetical protein ACRBBW_20420 [Cellvibrionaceae bacterium]